MTIDSTDYQGWPNCYRVSNGEVEAVITSDVGPRIMRYGFVGGQNFLKEFTEQLGRAGEHEWQPRGGHRLWAAPEDRVRTYAPDNDPVTVTITDGVLEAVQPVEPLTGLEKRMALRMAPAGTAMELTHTIRNAGREPVTLAPWAVTMMTPGGTGIHGLPPRGTHPENLSPTNPMVMWAFTDLTDPRWTFLRQYLCLRQDPQAATPQKLGSFHPQTWGAYLLNGELFVKRTEAPGSPTDYPDFGCSFETFTNAEFLELETLGRITTLAPGAAATHTERWHACRNVRLGAWSNAELDRVIQPLLR